MRERYFHPLALILLFVLMLSALLISQVSDITAKSKTHRHNQSIIVPENVAVIVRPLLDLRHESIRQCGIPGTPSKCIDGQAYIQEHAREEKFNQLLQRLITQQGPSIDESLVVLMWFHVGESGEEVDSVIKRGRRALPFLHKYRDRIPVISNRVYEDSMLQSDIVRQEHFKAAMFAIK